VFLWNISVFPPSIFILLAASNGVTRRTTCLRVPQKSRRETNSAVYCSGYQNVYVWWLQLFLCLNVHECLL